MTILLEAMFWTVLQILVAIILTLNSSVPIFILAAFLNGFSMGGSVGQRIVLIIDLIGQKLLASIIWYGPYYRYIVEKIHMGHILYHSSFTLDRFYKLFSEAISCAGKHLCCTCCIFDAAAFCDACRPFQQSFSDILPVNFWWTYKSDHNFSHL